MCFIFALNIFEYIFYKFQDLVICFSLWERQQEGWRFDPRPGSLHVYPEPAEVLQARSILKMCVWGELGTLMSCMALRFTGNPSGVPSPHNSWEGLRQIPVTMTAGVSGCRRWMDGWKRKDLKHCFPHICTLLFQALNAAQDPLRFHCIIFRQSQRTQALKKKGVVNVRECKTLPHQQLISPTLTD